MLRFKSILIIDNDPICVYLVTKEIQRSNVAAEVYTAKNGESALGFIIDYFKEHRDLPEVILTDLHMPVMNGMEFVRRLKKLPFFKSDKTILATITSSENYEELEMVKSEGINYLFPKPFKKDYLKFLKLIKISRIKPLLYRRIFKKQNAFLSKAS